MQGHFRTQVGLQLQIEMATYLVYFRYNGTVRTLYGYWRTDWRSCICLTVCCLIREQSKKKYWIWIGGCRELVSNRNSICICVYLRVLDVVVYGYASRELQMCCRVVGCIYRGYGMIIISVRHGIMIIVLGLWIYYGVQGSFWVIFWVIVIVIL